MGTATWMRKKKMHERRAKACQHRCQRLLGCNAVEARR